MAVREAVPSDSEAVRSVHKASITELGREGYSQEQVDAWAQGCDSADYAAAIDADESYFVVEDESAVVGFGSITFEAYETPIDAEITGFMSIQQSGAGVWAQPSTLNWSGGREKQGSKHSALLRHVTPFHFTRFRATSASETTHEFSSHDSTGVTGTVVEMRKDL